MSGAVAVPVIDLAVEVPASSANLGPGFDALAAALDVTLLVTASPRQDRRVVNDGLGSGELPDDDTNLVWRALLAYCDAMGEGAPDITLVTDNNIPLERGLGSSAAAAVAGAALARELLGRKGTDDDLIRIATEIEGHPDNAAAAVLGGVVVCADGTARRLEPASTLWPVLCVPHARQSTSAARSVLPEAVPLAAAAANGARVAMVAAGLSGHVAWEPAFMHDVLHEPARFEVMPDTGRLVDTLRGQGIGACLSGAGPAVLAVVPVGDRATVAAVEQAAGGGWDVLEARWHRRGASRVNADRRRVGARLW